ncbi:MAG: porin [Byssovorax sp.]
MKSIARASVFAAPFLAAALTVSLEAAADEPAAPPPAASAPSSPPAAPADKPADKPAGDAKPAAGDGAPPDGAPPAHGMHDGHGGHHGHGDHHGPHGDADDDEGDEPHAHHHDGSGDRMPDLHEYLRLRLGPLAISPVLLMQAQAMPYIGGDSLLQAGDPAERAGFKMRRARFGFEGRAFSRIPFKISAEFNSDFKGTALLHDAWFGYDKWKPLQVFAGAHDVPFSRSAMMSSGGSALIERPYAVRSMAPFYQVGISAHGSFWKGALHYAAGVYNGLTRSDQFFFGYQENSAVNGNRFDGLTYAARLGSDPFGDMGHTMQDLHKGDFKLGVGASVFFSNGGTRNILGAGGDVLAKWKGFHLLGEFLMNKSDPRTVPTQPSGQITTIQSLGVVGELGYMILKERLGVTARVEWIDPNTSVKNEADSLIVAGGASYHLFHDVLKAQLDFTHRQELAGKSLDNDSLVLQLQLHL